MLLFVEKPSLFVELNYFDFRDEKGFYGEFLSFYGELKYY
jgi:hypothetical protein